jgi:acetyl esterase/lipase
MFAKLDFQPLRGTAIAVLLLTCHGSAMADQPALTKTTHTYKTVGSLKIEADVYRADDAEVRPVVVWLHGGALIMGSRNSVPANLLDLCRKEGFALISFDYRLAPEVKLPTIAQDIKDAFHWLREQAPALRIDPDRMVVAGGSAGGYLTLMTGVHIKPRPTALVAYWGYGDVDGDWYTKPSDFYRRSTPLIDKDEALRAVGQRVLTGTDGSSKASAEEQKARGRYYHYLRQNGLWTKDVTGLDPSGDRGKFDPFCPVRNVSPDYPPTLLVHGTEDTDVPYELSAAMAKELTRHKVAHELVTVKGAGHGLSGGDKKLVAAAHELALAFIRRHLKPEKKPAAAAPAKAKAAPAKAVDFNRDVRPILAANCLACHGPDEHARQAKLRLDTPEGATADRGGYQALKPGDPQASELIRRITTNDPDEHMPPPDSKKTLTAAQIETLRRWVAEGGRYEQHWAFVPPKRPALPDVQKSAAAAWQHWPQNPIDNFILDRLLREGLHPSAEADRYTLVRRLYLDLIGLPPTPEEADAFVNDGDVRAYEQLVDRLLQSKHYGQRWARKWLDLARYADTNGYEKDRARNIWPYRDWVIRALNADMPFDRFTIEQLAGDMLPGATQDQHVATGFHRNTMLNEEGGIDPLEFRFHAMTDRVATTGTTWLGLTLGCVQCHSHKYDPVVHREYYQFMALLNNADEPEVDLVTPEWNTAYRSQLQQAEKLLAELPDKWPLGAASPTDKRPAAERRREAVEAAFQKWLKGRREAMVPWTSLRPREAKSNLPLLTVQDDDSVFASGDISKVDTYELTFAAVPKGVTAVRLEALPDERLPAHGPGMAYYEGPKGDFFLGEFTLFAGERKLKIARASESFAKNNFGSNPGSAMLATDGDPQTGWSCAGRVGEPHQAVFVLSEPFAGGDLKLTMRFGRHYACSLGRFRISITTDPRGGQAHDLPREIELLLSIPDERLTQPQRLALREQFLLTAPELAKDAQRVRELRRPPAAQTTLVMRERPRENPRPTFRHHRGEFLQPKERVEGGIPSVLKGGTTKSPRNRLELARWLVSRDNPLSARVVVNRQWAALFGQGLVRTQGDFGLQGEPPSHAELLDWLAIEFMDGGWSLKRLHRLIVTSATYRQSSQVMSPAHSVSGSGSRSDPTTQDPQNRLLARAPRVRLEAELIRDAALRASGLLSDKMFGPPVRPPQPDGVTEVAYGGAAWQASTGEDRYRRGIYTFQKRTAPFAMFTTFDAPSGEVCVAQRDNSNTPLQSLTLLNDPVFVEAARALGALAAQTPGNDEVKATLLFRRCLTRPPSGSELEKLVAFVRAQRERLARGELKAAELAPGGSGDAGQRAAWTALARAVLNLDETITRT